MMPSQEWKPETKELSMPGRKLNKKSKKSTKK
jgi:hypothetical protein